jgi:formate hydrogenlyase transcriptional activator
MPRSSDSTRSLHGCINDLVSLVALPALWRGREPAVILAILLDAMMRTLTLEFAYARVNSAGEGKAVDVAHSVAADPRESKMICKAMRSLLQSLGHDPAAAIDNPIGTGKVFLTHIWLGNSKDLGVVVVASRRRDFPTDIDMLLLMVASNAAVMELREDQVRSERLRREEAERVERALHAENLYLRNEITTEQGWDEIVGRSRVLKNTLKLVERVAPTDACVLIQGETGTGKELIARAVHRLSPRHDRVFVKLNCAAIPTGLIESELFGHEKGAFTGAVARKIGRFELGDGGTIFLDEVGEIPLELQSKLLRILQEQEFERLGSLQTLRVNVRLVAATNRDLKQMAADGLFRSDLYYRLSVFPIRMPALREHADDIPELVRHFVSLHAQRIKRSVPNVPAATMSALENYAWPGNVRELENFIERSVILTQERTLEAPLGELKSLSRKVATGLTLHDMECSHIAQALYASNWVLGGPEGAAEKLGMKRTTLQYKMQKLGLVRPG